MRRTLSCLILSLALPLAAGASGEGAADADDLVRLPGQPAARASAEGGAPLPGLPKKGEKLVPGGILFVSFDTNGDGEVSPEELSAGITEAFAAADANGDGQIGALEQQAWAASFAVRDDTLANPVRFDPNLDRVVTFEEFSSVILQLAASYQDSAGTITTARLTQPDKSDRDDSRQMAERAWRGNGPPDAPQR